MSPHNSHMFGHQADVACWGDLQGSTCIRFHAKRTAASECRAHRVLTTPALGVAAIYIREMNYLFYCTCT